MSLIYFIILIVFAKIAFEMGWALLKEALRCLGVEFPMPKKAKAETEENKD